MSCAGELVDFRCHTSKSIFREAIPSAARVKYRVRALRMHGR